jgi:hypothetical protein
MDSVKLDYALDRSLITDDVDRLDIICVIVSHADDTTDLYLVEVFCGHRVLEVALVHAVALFRDHTRYAVTQSPESVVRKGCFIFFK